VESTHLKARVIRNLAASGGGYEPEELRQELEDYELEWITTRAPETPRRLLESGRMACS
jgi:hypothetical protein